MSKRRLIACALLTALVFTGCAPRPKGGAALVDLPREEACAIAAAALENLLDDREGGKLPWSHIAARTRSASRFGPAVTLADCPAVRERIAGTSLSLMEPFEIRRGDEIYVRLTTPGSGRSTATPWSPLSAWTTASSAPSTLPATAGAGWSSMSTAS